MPIPSGDAGDIDEINVWVGTPRADGVYSYPTLWGNDPDAAQSWVLCHFLLPLTCTRNQNATFELHPHSQDLFGVPEELAVLTIDDLSETQWICITVGPSLEFGPDPDNMLWIGRIDGIQLSYYQGSELDAVGQVHAVGVWEILHQGSLEDMTISTGPGSGPTGTRIIQGKSSFNYEQDGFFIGNHVEFNNSPVFQSDPLEFTTSRVNESVPDKRIYGWEDSDKAWTAYRVLQHEIERFNESNATTPNLELAGTGGEQSLFKNAAQIIDRMKSNKIPRAWDTSGMSIGQVLDYLFNRPEGLGWTIVIDSAAFWTIVPYSFNDKPISVSEPAVFLPAPEIEVIDLDGVSEVDLTINKVDNQTYDGVIVKGSNIIAWGTATGPKIKSGTNRTSIDWSVGTLMADWRPRNPSDYDPFVRSEPENEWLAGSDGGENFGVNISLATNFRADHSYEDFFQQWRIRDTDANGEFDAVLKLFDDPTSLSPDGSQFAMSAWCPAFTWDAIDYTLTYDKSKSDDKWAHSTPYLPNAKILDFIPIKSGMRWNSSGKFFEYTSFSSNLTQSSNDFIRPQLYTVVKPIITDGVVQDGFFTCLNHSENTVRPAIRPIAGARVRFELAQPIMQAQSEFVQFEDNFGFAPPTVDNQHPVDSGAGVDWRLYCFSCAVACNDRVQGEAYDSRLVNQPITNVDTPEELEKEKFRLAKSKASKLLVIEDPALACYFVHKNTAVGLQGTKMLTTDGDHFLRNDFPIAQSRANQIGAYMFRSRKVMSLTMRRFDLIPRMSGNAPSDSWNWAQPGTMVGYVKDSSANHALFTVVENVTINFNRQNPQLMVKTSPPPQLNFSGSSGGITSSGDAPILPTFQKSMSSQVQSLRTSMKDVNRKLGRIPLIADVNAIPTSTTGPVLIRVLGGGNLLITIDGTDFEGVKGAPDTPPTTVPAATPDGDTIYDDGLGVGRIVGESENVWIASIVEIDGNEKFDTNMTVPEGHYFYSKRVVDVQIAGEDAGVTAPVYLVWFV